MIKTNVISIVNNL